MYFRFNLLKPKNITIFRFIFEKVINCNYSKQQNNLYQQSECIEPENFNDWNIKTFRKHLSLKICVGNYMEKITKDQIDHVVFKYFIMSSQIPKFKN